MKPPAVFLILISVLFSCNNRNSLSNENYPNGNDVNDFAVKRRKKRISARRSQEQFERTYHHAYRQMPVFFDILLFIHK